MQHVIDSKSLCVVIPLTGSENKNQSNLKGEKKKKYNQKVTLHSEWCMGLVRCFPGQELGGTDSHHRSYDFGTSYAVFWKS